MAPTLYFNGWWCVAAADWCVLCVCVAWCAVEQWGGWFLFGLFAAILVWEEVWDLPDTAYLSSWLLLIITGGAVVCSAFFERRLWCR